MQLSAEDTYDVAGKVLEIPLDRIREAPDNVRSDLGDLEELAASIREVGVLQPITVIPDGDGVADTFMVFIGARRRAAAELAGLKTIPSIVLPKPEDAKRVIAMLIENVHRRDLSAIDEARTFERLADLGLEQDEIANRVGCSQSHVSKRLSLLDLPVKARQMVIDGELGIGDAVDLARLAEHPDRLKTALDHIVKGGWEADRAIEQQLAEVEANTAIAGAVAKLEAKGVEILWTQTQVGLTSKQHDAKQKAIGTAAKVVKSGGYHYGKVIEFDKPSAHLKEPCHRVVLEHAHGKKVDQIGYCADTKRHAAKGDSTLKAAKKPKAEATPRDPAIAERDRRRAEIAEHRTAFVTDLVQHRDYDRGLVTTLALSRFILDWSDAARVAALLGLDVGDEDPMSALGTYMHAGSDQLLRATLAALLEDTVSAHARHVPEGGTDLLDKFGYQPTEAEAAEIAEREADRERARIESEAYDAADLQIARARELDPNRDHDDINGWVDELEEEGITIERVNEISQALDHKFVEINDLQPGDTVTETADGGTVIDRDVDRDTGPAVANTGDPTVLDPPDNDEDDDCPFPGCTLIAEHEGNHRLKLSDYTKAPKDCSVAEHTARLEIEPLLGRLADHDELRGLHEELLAGVDNARATELLARVREISHEHPAVLTDYRERPRNTTERSCRTLIAALPADDDRVIALQQELYAGVTMDRAGAIKKQLKTLKTELVGAAS